MKSDSAPDPPRSTRGVTLDPATAADLAAQFQRASAAAAQAPLVVDLHRVGVVGPELLRALSARIDAGGEIVLTGVTPEVYKALHVAGLAAHVRRA